MAAKFKSSHRWRKEDPLQAPRQRSRQSHSWEQSRFPRTHSPWFSGPAGSKSGPTQSMLPTPEGLPSPGRSGPTRCSSYRWWTGRAAPGTPRNRPLLCSHRACKGTHGSEGQARGTRPPSVPASTDVKGAAWLTRQNILSIHGTWGGLGSEGLIWTTQPGRPASVLKKLIFNRSIYCLLSCDRIHSTRPKSREM